MRIFSQHRRHVRIAVILIVIAGGALLFPYDTVLTGQVVRDAPVIYKQCRFRASDDSGAYLYARDALCGIDEEAMRVARDTRERTIAFQREAEANNRPLTREEEKAVIEHIERQLLQGTPADHRVALHTLLETAERRLLTLLEGNQFNLTDEERDQLQVAYTFVLSLQDELTDALVSKRKLRDVRDRLSPVLTVVQAMLTGKQRTKSGESPSVENLVTQIDALVARVGTVIRELELSGKPVPAAVRSGHRRALQILREAKQTCSTRRPANCSRLMEVLDVIDDMREPLCAIDSPLLAFCH